MSAQLDVKTPGYHVLDITSGNGVEVVVNGRTMLKHLNPYRTKERVEKVLLELPVGQTSIIVRSYNRFEDSLVCGVRLSGFQEMYTKKVKLPSRLGPGVRTIKVYADDMPSPHSDCGLHNLRIRL
jgi:alpha-L-fucosidase